MSSRGSRGAWEPSKAAAAAVRTAAQCKYITDLNGLFDVRVPLSPVAQTPRCLHNTRRCIRTFWDHSAGDVSAVCWGGGGAGLGNGRRCPCDFQCGCCWGSGNCDFAQGKGAGRPSPRKEKGGGGGGRKGGSHDRPEGLFKAPPAPRYIRQNDQRMAGDHFEPQMLGYCRTPPPQKKELDPPPPPARKPISHCVMCGLCRVSCGTQHGRHPCGRHPPSRHCDW